MSEADKMFKKLGYKKRQYSYGDIFYYQENGLDEEYGIEFHIKDREIYPVCKGKELEAITISMQELKAINKKVEELGWND